jgi:hypothetical protein
MSICSATSILKYSCSVNIQLDIVNRLAPNSPVLTPILIKAYETHFKVTVVINNIQFIDINQRQDH